MAAPIRSTTSSNDGPSSSLFTPLPLLGGVPLGELAATGVSSQMAEAAAHAPTGSCVCWGIPFEVGDPLVIGDSSITASLSEVRARWLVFLHTSDARPQERDEHDFPLGKDGAGRLGEHAADYLIRYADGAQERQAIRRRHHLGAFLRGWGENCFEAVPHSKPRPIRAHHEQAAAMWGWSQTRATTADLGRWVYWLWAWENPRPDADIVEVSFAPMAGAVVVAGLTAGMTATTPLRWETRRKAILRLPEGEGFEPTLDDLGRLRQLQLDLGQVISATPRPLYPAAAWSDTINNALPEISASEVLIEYTSHPEARFHLAGGVTVPVAELRDFREASAASPLAAAPAATRRVRLRAVEKGSGAPTAVKLHVHGEAGEYLAALDRHRIPNSAWFEDYSPEFVHLNLHPCAYIPGETVLDLPLGRVYVEVSKGFEIRPVRTAVEVTLDTEEIVLELERVLPWRARGWVTADTHVHFLSPPTALLEGAGEGVNLVNLLASQWGELMTNVGDFDGKTTFGSREAGGDGEYIVRVGTENRQHVLGHISLLGYDGRIIAPMTTGGPDESALGDPVGILLTEWARQCKQQHGVVVLPHFPNPRAEHAAAVVSGDVDAIEMTSWGNLYAGINPYSLVDWYRYLNCGYRTAAVGGTDKMSSGTAVGTVRTYAHLRPDEPFTLEAWKAAIRRAETFVTYGPLLEMSLEGAPMGERLSLPAGGGTLTMSWRAASVTIPMTRAELIVNGEVRESRAIQPDQDEGCWSVSMPTSGWAALLVRGQYPGMPEIVAAHSSPVMVAVEGSPPLTPADAVTILRQIEGALAYLDSVGTRAEDAAYQRMRLVLTSAHRSLHNRMHEQGQFHAHTPVEEHHQ